MTRRKKPPPQRKRQQITDSLGWTHVIKGPPGITDPKTTTKHLNDHGKLTSTNYTLETYLDKFRKHYAPTWRESDCFKNLSRIFEQDILPTPNIPITQCICLGLGSMTAGSENSSYELAALISMLEILGILPMPPTLHNKTETQTTSPTSPTLPSPTKPDPLRKNPPHPINHLPRPHLHPPRHRHPPKTRLHRRRPPQRIFKSRQRHVPLRAPS